MKKPNDWKNMADDEKIGYRSAVDDIIEELMKLRRTLYDSREEQLNRLMEVCRGSIKYKGSSVQLLKKIRKEK